MTTYPRVTPRSQFGDPTTTQDGSNCTPTAFVMLGELATGLELWPGTFRSFQSDQVGGISIPDGARAWPLAFPGASLQWSAPNDGTPVPAGRVGDGLTADTLWATLVAGAGVVAQGIYKVLEDAGIGLQPGFTEGHAVYVEGARTEVRVGRQVYLLDPLGRQPGYTGRWIAFDLLLRYARALSGSALVYAAWAAPRLPDTDTEDPMGPLMVTSTTPMIVDPIEGRQLLRADASPGPTVSNIGAITSPYEVQYGGGAKARAIAVSSSGILQLLFVRVTDCASIKPVPPVGGDVQHTVTVLKDGTTKLWEGKV